MSVRDMTDELREGSSILKLDQDNEATITTILHDVTSRRPRHYALRAEGIRALVAKAYIVVLHTRGHNCCWPSRKGAKQM